MILTTRSNIVFKMWLNSYFKISNLEKFEFINILKVAFKVYGFNQPKMDDLDESVV